MSVMPDLIRHPPINTLLRRLRVYARNDIRMNVLPELLLQTVSISNEGTHPMTLSHHMNTLFLITHMTLQDNFEIRLPQFEGPFDLLLFFIERDELDIQDVPIARITDDFLDYLHHMTSLNMEIASEFIFVAATLMRIKAKMLLPRPDLDDEGNEIDLKRDLIQKLIEYKRFKQVSEELRILENERFKQERRGHIHLDMEHTFLPSQPGEELESFDLYKLMLTFNKLIQKSEQRNNKQGHVVEQYPYNIEEQKKVIDRLLVINKRLDFKGLLSTSENKVHFVYNFLALLEMLQQDLISIQTGLGFNNFWIQAKVRSNES
jgi:segregation and condensation protein A